MRWGIERAKANGIRVALITSRLGRTNAPPPALNAISFAKSDIDDMAVVAVAGRRIDAAGASPPRFPLENITRVQQEVCCFLDEMQATALASSAANGADLIAAKCALDRLLPIHIVLPFDVESFKLRSVIDRPGDWEKRFDDVIAAAKARGSLRIMSGSPDDESSYVAANHVILDTAARHDPMPKALVIWDGYSRGNEDITDSFADEATKRGMPIHYVLTVS